ncbi:MAG: nickel pincer cofactor biosynthesis protein LarB [Planctomycetia bacterium]|nr:nickel pincer cofactor biosynthesis protein LarB [Planctomycetia bacterium]
MSSPERSAPETRADDVLEIEDAILDLDREKRCGFSEVIYGQSKTAEAILKIALAQCQYGIDVFATRVDAQKAQFVLPEIKRVCADAYYNAVARTLRAPCGSVSTRENRGKIAILTAGTSDLPVAEEARETALWTGADAILIQDVGVAGPQRLRAKLPLIEDADVVVVVAGMEGALPSVVGGYVSAPIIAVPTSVGYGASFQGLAALLGMLNSCASNVTVVNIDAGFKAGYVAGLIAKRVRDAVARAKEL